MRIGFSAIIFLTLVASSTLIVFGQSTVLNNATFFSTSFNVNDAVYDRTRDVVFATTPSSEGLMLGNRLLEINPADGVIVNATFVGSEPNQLAISRDGSRIYIGIDGAQGVRSFTPDTATLGEIASLSDDSGPAVADDIAVPPGFPDLVVVSRNNVGFSANGFLRVFNVTGTTLTPTFSEPMNFVFTADNIISFINRNRLFTFNNTDTGLGGMLYDFDGQALTLDISQTRVVSGANIEVETGSDGQIYFTNGVVLDGSDLSPEGTFDTGLVDRSALVEPVPALGLTYFAGATSLLTSRTVNLNVFDNETFELIDSVELSGVNTDDPRGQLIAAGENRLAFFAQATGSSFTGPGPLTFISNIPVDVPILGDVNQDGVVDFSDIPAFIAVLQMGQFQAEADCNQDGVVDFADIPAFIDILIAQ